MYNPKLSLRADTQYGSKDATDVMKKKNGVQVKHYKWHKIIFAIQKNKHNFKPL